MAMGQGGVSNKPPGADDWLSVKCRETGVVARALLAAIHCGRLCGGHHCGNAEKNNAGNKCTGNERDIAIVRGVNFFAMSENI